MLPIVNYSVQLDVIGRVGQNTMHDDNLFPCYQMCIRDSFMTMGKMMWGLIIAELVLVFTLSAAINRLSLSVATFSYRHLLLLPAYVPHNPQEL